MYHSNLYAKMTIQYIFNQLKHILLKALVAQWVHPFMVRRLGESIYNSSEYDGQLNNTSLIWSIYTGTCIPFQV